MPDSFKSFKKGVERKGTAYEKARYIGNEEIPNNMFTIYVRRSVNGDEEKYIVGIEDVEELEYVLKFPVSDSEDRDFVEQVIVLGMVTEWLEPQVKSVLNTAQLFTNSEQKFYSQANHLDTLQDLLKKSQNDQRKLIRDRGYIYNSYIVEI